MIILSNVNSMILYRRQVHSFSSDDNSIFTTIDAVTPTAACITRKPHSRALGVAELIRNDDIYGPARRLHRNELIGS